MMTPRERVLTTLKRNGKPDKTPFEISWGAFTPRLMKTFLQETGSDQSPEEYYDFDIRYVLPAPTKRKTDFTRFFKKGVLEDNSGFDEWGIGSVPTLYEIPDYRYHPLERMSTVEEINNYPWPDMGEAYRYADVAKQTKDFQERGYPVCGEMYQTIFETAWLMRDMQALLSDLMLNEDIAHAIFENLTRIRINQARHFAEAGVDIIRLGDDVVSQQGLMMSGETYNTFLKPRIKRIIQAAKEVNPDVIIFMHCCGKVEEVIDDFIEAGVEVLNPLQPECNDLKWIHNKYSSKLSFWGGIGLQSTMYHGSPEEVAAKVQEVDGIFGMENGFLVAPAHILDPSIPWDNIIAFINAAKNL
jgi:uroporphyrinogen decarboxylase